LLTEAEGVSDDLESRLEHPHQHAGSGNTMPRSRSMMEFPRNIPGRAYRAKKSRIMRWLVLHSSGEKQSLTLDKRQVIQTLGLDIPSRDMRLLDSNLINYDTIGQLLVRDNALVFSMEHVRLIITADKVIIPLEDDKNDAKDRFIMFLEHLLQEREPPSPGTKGANTAFLVMPSEGGGLPRSPDVPLGTSYGSSVMRHSVRDDKDEMPFELQVLEAALGEICNHLAREVDHLNAQAQPALEDLTKNADQPTLERVRRIKTTHQRLLGRVKLVREVLERLMEDDADMWRMCLSRQQARRQPPPGMSPPTAAANTSMGRMPAAQAAAVAQEVAASMGALVGSVGRDELERPSVPEFGTPVRHPSLLALNLRRYVSTNENIGSLEGDEYHELLDVENLLESYFMLVDSTLQSLEGLGEYIDDTEDLINIQLDYSRNKLIRFEILLTTGTFVLAFFSAVAGMLGENLVLPETITQDLLGFVLVNGGTFLLCALMFWGVYIILLKKKLI